MGAQLPAGGASLRGRACASAAVWARCAAQPPCPALPSATMRAPVPRWRHQVAGAASLALTQADHVGEEGQAHRNNGHEDHVWQEERQEKMLRTE